MSDSTPGWQPDPTGKHDHRYWDGSRWTDDVADAGVAGTDPYEPVAAEPVAPVDESPAPVEEPVAPIEEPTSADLTVVDQEVPPPDATATYPAATDGPAAWADAPAPPPPYVPVDPIAEGGGPKKGLLIGGGILAAVVVAIIAFMAFGGDDDSPTQNASQSSDGADAGDPTDTTAREGTYGSDPDLDELYDSCEAGVFADCDLLYFDSPSDSEYEHFGDTCGNRNEPGEICAERYADDGTGDDGGSTGGATTPDDPREQLAEMYQSILDIDSDQAQCLADKMADAIGSGTIDEDQATSAVMDFLSDCDIDLDEIGAN